MLDVGSSVSVMLSDVVGVSVGSLSQETIVKKEINKNNKESNFVFSFL